jgi:hypothetical protein
MRPDIIVSTPPTITSNPYLDVMEDTEPHTFEHALYEIRTLDIVEDLLHYLPKKQLFDEKTRKWIYVTLKQHAKKHIWNVWNICWNLFNKTYVGH